MKKRKGIVLAGGTGSRLWPLTIGLSKQLLPVFDKPMIYYPLSALMLSGIKEIAIITTPEDQSQFQRVLGDGSQWGVALTYIVQPAPEGLAQAYLLAEEFLDASPSAMVLGDNLFFGHGLTELLRAADDTKSGATIFGYQVADPERYGVVEFDRDRNVRSIEEKPKKPKSNFAVTGLYFMDHQAPKLARSIVPSSRGELEIVSLLELYRQQELLRIELMGRGFAWLDTGTHSSLLDASNFVRTLTLRQGLQVGSLDEIAFRNGFISLRQLEERAHLFRNNEYGAYLSALTKAHPND